MDVDTNLLKSRFQGAKIEGSGIKFAIRSLCDERGELINFPEEEEARKGTDVREKEKRFDVARTVYLDFKNYFKKEGRYEESGMFFIREREMIRELLKIRRDWTKWFVQTLAFRIGTYGERPFDVLKMGFFVIILFAAIFFVTDSIQGAEPNLSAESFFKDYVYFSAVTFTTLGYGDLKPEGWIRLCAAFEAILGAFFMAYFVITWSRKIIR